MSVTETLGKVQSVTDAPKPSISAVTISTLTSTTVTTTNATISSSSSSPTTMTATGSIPTSPTSGTPKSTGSGKMQPNVSYSATSKPVVPTRSSTRTRTIKTPKQYDL